MIKLFIITAGFISLVYIIMGYLYYKRKYFIHVKNPAILLAKYKISLDYNILIREIFGEEDISNYSIDEIREKALEKIHKWKNNQ